MRFALILTLILCLITPAYADCDWSQIKKNQDNTYTYSPQLHLCVGELIQNSKAKDQQIEHLKKAIELSDLALSKSQAQNEAWLTTSIKVQDQILKYQSASEAEGWWHFGLGVATTALAVWGAGQLRR